MREKMGGGERLLLCSWFFAILLYADNKKVSAHVTAIIVFGDSSVDAGNNNQILTIARCNFEPYGRDFPGGKPTGRFCNGRLATDFLAEAFGLKTAVPAYLDPEYGIEDFATGVTFASAASGFDNATAGVLSVIPLWKELEYFKEYEERLRIYQGEEEAKTTLAEALYVISMGTNDFLENYYAIPGGGRRFDFPDVGDYEDFLVDIAGGFITEMYRLGARKFDLSGLGPVGCIPVSRIGGSCREDYNAVAVDFNGKLRALAARLNAELAGSRVVFAGLYDAFLDVIKHPHSYGFEEAGRGCCGTGLFEASYACRQRFTCPDANKYIFWDSVHPSEMMYRILADHVMTTSLAQFL